MCVYDCHERDRTVLTWPTFLNTPSSALDSRFSVGSWEGDLNRGYKLLIPARGFETGQRVHQPTDVLRNDRRGCCKRYLGQRFYGVPVTS